MDEVLQAKFVEKCELEHIRTADEVARVNNIKRYASDVSSGSWHVVVSKQTVGVAVTADAGHLFNVQLDSTQYSSHSRSEQSEMRTGVIGIGKGLIILCMAGTWRGAMQQTHRHSSLAILCHRRRPFRSLCSSLHSSSASPIYGRLVQFCLTHPPM